MGGIVVKTKVGGGEFLFQHRESGEQGERGALSAVRRYQQDFAFALKESPGHVAIHSFGKSDGAILQADVDVVAIEPGIADLVGSGGADANAAQLAIQRHGRGRLLGKHIAGQQH